MSEDALPALEQYSTVTICEDLAEMTTRFPQNETVTITMPAGRPATVIEVFANGADYYLEFGPPNAEVMLAHAHQIATSNDIEAVRRDNAECVRWYEALVGAEKVT